MGVYNSDKNYLDKAKDTFILCGMTYARFQFDPYRESGEQALEQRMAEVSDAAQDAEAWANEAEEEGDFAAADEWLRKRDGFERQYDELRRAHDTQATGW